MGRVIMGWSRGARRRRLVALASLIVVLLVLALPATSHAAPGDYTATDVNNAVAKGVAFLDTLQNADGSFGTSFPGAETAFALIAYGVLDKGDFHNLSAAMQTHVHDAVTWLLGTQSATDG